MTAEERELCEVLDGIAASIHRNAVQKGFYSCYECQDANGIREHYKTRECSKCKSSRLDNSSIEQRFLLMVSEISEAYEGYRAGRDLAEVYVKDGKPEGVPVELADVIIRIFDLCAWKSISIGEIVLQKMRYNESRPYRHGGKRS